MLYLNEREVQKTYKIKSLVKFLKSEETSCKFAHKKKQKNKNRRNK